MQPFSLIAHPQHPPVGVRSVQAHVLGTGPDGLRVCWRVDGAQALVLPVAAGTARADGLWQTTCFEVFLKPDDGTAYMEWNLSPSGSWNAYDFAAYRDGMTPRPLQRAPRVSMRSEGDAGKRVLIVDAELPMAGVPPRPSRLGISAVLEEQGGHKSYWALAHPNGGAPDFHADGCFTARLAHTTTAT